MHARSLARPLSAIPLLFGLVAQSPMVQLNGAPAISLQSYNGVAVGDAVYVAWSDQSGTHLQRSLDRGRTWLGEQLLPLTWIDGRPRIIASGSDVHTFTVDWNATTSAYDLRHTRSQDHASTWQAPVALVTGLTYYSGVVWAGATDAAIFVVWNQVSA